MTFTTFTKDPDAVLDYLIDFAQLRNGRGLTDYLQAGETISTAVVTSSSVDITIDSSSRTDTNSSVTIWLSGGVLNFSYDITVRITTSDARTDDRTITIRIRQK